MNNHALLSRLEDYRRSPFVIVRGVFRDGAWIFPDHLASEAYSGRLENVELIDVAQDECLFRPTE